jgi:bifunctional non-homologous end joining protein LigD
MPKTTITLGGVQVSNPDKVLYPAVGFTKTDVVSYYLSAAPFILPHLRNRPVSFKRFPDGVGRPAFWEKDAPGYAPAWVKTFPVSRTGGGRPIRYVLVNDQRTLAWCANLAALELHPFLHRAPRIERPTLVVFDLDPGEGADIFRCAEVALRLREKLERLELQAFPKVSGSKGLQIYVPLNTAVSYDLTQPFARTLAELLAQEHPRLIIAEMARAQRKGKVFIDWSQNTLHKTTVAVYSLRAKRERPYVSMPVSWPELERALAARDRSRLEFEPEAALARLGKVGDLFAPVLKLEQRLPAAFAQAARRRPA